MLVNFCIGQATVLEAVRFSVDRGQRRSDCLEGQVEKRNFFPLIFYSDGHDKITDEGIRHFVIVWYQD